MARRKGRGEVNSPNFLGEILCKGEITAVREELLEVKCHAIKNHNVDVCNMAIVKIKKDWTDHLGDNRHLKFKVSDVINCFPNIFLGTTVNCGTNLRLQETVS